MSENIQEDAQEKIIKILTPGTEDRWVHLKFTRPDSESLWIMTATDEFITDFTALHNGNKS